SFRAPQDGVLTIRVVGNGVDTRSVLSLRGDFGSVVPLNQSDAGTSGPDDLIVQHVLAGGTYFLTITSLKGQGSYTISTSFENATSPGALIAVPEGPFDVISADFNGDGVLDLATVSPSTGSLQVLFGTGDGTVQTFPTADSTGKYDLDDDPVALTSGDFNHDGRIDLAVVARPRGPFDNPSSDPGELVVLLNNGDGTFTEAGRFENPGTPEALTAGDFNDDGNLDLATANSGSNAILVFLGDGTGQFQAITDQNGQPLEFLVGGYPTALTTVQLNDDNVDGKIDSGDFLDLAVAVDLPGLLPDGSAAGAVVLLRGTGDGFFSAPSAPFAVGEAPKALVAAQLNDDNGDGKIDDRDFVDLVTANSVQDFQHGGSNFRGDVSVLFGTGPGTFAPELRLPAGFLPQDIVVGDFNNDGLPDLATV